MSSRLVVDGEEALECAVVGGVVGDLVLPAVPDDVEPGSGEDADGVGVVVSACSGAVVEVGGPGVGVAGVGGEVGEGVAELFVAGPAEADRAEFPGLAGGGGGAGQAGQGFGGGQSGAAVADLGEQAGGADSSGAGQAGEDAGVGVRVELVVDLGRECLDLGVQGLQQRDVGGGDRGLAGGVFAGGSAGCVDETLVQDGGVDLAGVALLARPLAEASGGEPVGAVLGLEPGQERQGDLGVDRGEQADGAGEDVAQVRAELVRGRDTVLDQVFSGTAGATQRESADPRKVAQ